MGKSTTGLRVLPSPEDIRQLLRVKIVAAVQEILEEEIALLLGSQRYERSESRNGYRNGGERRHVAGALQFAAADARDGVVAQDHPGGFGPQPGTPLYSDRYAGCCPAE